MKVNVTDSKVTEYVANISVARISAIVKQLHEIHLEIKNSEVPQWTVTRAVFFASTVVTTIGMNLYFSLTDFIAAKFSTLCRDYFNFTICLPKFKHEMGNMIFCDILFLVGTKVNPLCILNITNVFHAITF